jgi:4-amino-4-deoxy-L-arabinose transferase-like glycosyltransferase
VRRSLLVVALATALRLAWVLAVPTRPVGDFAMYLESAAHLVAHRALDPAFVYMPGYVLLLALVKAAGGGLLAAKLVGVALGGATAGAVYGITSALWDRRAALAAGLLYAVWPAGIVVTSVTGTDLPTAALVAFAGWALVRWGPHRPMFAAALFGALMGAAAWIRAVAMPLAVLSAWYFWAQGAPPGAVARRTAVAGLAAVLVLAPWALRNRLRYGETFFTDSHGGLTALVGANPNSEGRYSRSLNRLFQQVTGHRLLAEPHRLADREAYALAHQLTRFEPAYALGLVAAKAERLLHSERPLLYWPVYRRGVLADPPLRWFEGHQRAIEIFVEAFYWLVVGGAVFALTRAALDRRWVALSFVPFQLALIAIYALFFAEVRYQLPIVVFLFPPAGAALTALGLTFRGPAEWPALLRRIGIPAAALLVLLAGWVLFLRLGAVLRERHRFAAHACRVAGQDRVCLWRRAVPGPGDSGIHGLWNGVGLAPGAAARSAVLLPPGHYRVSAALDLSPVGTPAGPGTVTFSAGGAPPFTVALPALDELSRAGREQPVALDVQHPGGPLSLRLEVAGTVLPRLWLGKLEIAPLDGER